MKENEKCYLYAVCWEDFCPMSDGGADQPTFSLYRQQQLPQKGGGCFRKNLHQLLERSSNAGAGRQQGAPEPLLEVLIEQRPGWSMWLSA